MKTVIYISAFSAIALPGAANAQAYVQAQAGLDSVSAQGVSSEGVAFGVAAGYEVPFEGGIFVGVEASVDDSTTKDCESNVLVLNDTVCAKSGRDLAAVIRVGTKMGERGKLYLLGGYTNARLKVSYTSGAFSDTAAANADGFRLGAGYQHDFGDNLFGKVEYRYSNYESDFSRHNGIVAVGVRF